MKRFDKLVSILLIAFLIYGITYAKSQEVYLLPSRNGEPSQIVPTDIPSDPRSWLIQYDGGESGYYLSGLIAGDTLGVLFLPPAPCSLVEIHYCRYKWCEDSSDTYYGFVADVPDGVTLDSYEEYHHDSSLPGPSPIGDLYVRLTQIDLPYTLDWQWDTLVVPGQPDVGNEAFWAGYTIGDSCHSTRIDANVSPPYYGICWKQGGAAPETNGPGWYSSWHLFWVRALVKIYEQVFTGVSVEELKGTYSTEDRVVHVYSWDEDMDTSNIGVYPDSAFLCYCVRPVDVDTIVVPLIQDSVYYPYPQEENAWWHAIIPGQTPVVKVIYWVQLKLRKLFHPLLVSRPYYYKVKVGTPYNGLLYVEEDDWFGFLSGIHNAFSGLPWDIWNERIEGIADTTVTGFYTSGSGANAISWLSMSGFNLADWSFTSQSIHFINVGGCLFISSQDLPSMGYGLSYGEWNAPESPHPLRDYLKAYSGVDDCITESPFTIVIDTNDILTRDIPYQLNVDCTPIYPTYVGIFTYIDTICIPLFFDEEGNILGYRYEDPELGFKVVWLYFPFHAITDTVAQNTFIENLTNWFELGIEEEPEEVVYKPPLITPNPLSRTANISFTIPKNQQVSIKIYDVTGSLIKTLINERLTAGNHTLKINTDGLASGVYFLRMDIGSLSMVRKFVVVK